MVGRLAESFLGTRRILEGEVELSETYTAHYVRDGQTWVAEVADHPGMRTESSSIPEARQAIREALAQHLGAEATALNIVDKIGLPASFKKAQEEVRASRTKQALTEMALSMTEPRTAEEWAEDMDLAYRAPAAVDYLKSFGDRLINIEEMCYAISICEQVGMYDSERDVTALDEAIRAQKSGA
jgi:predicted RNase H-like HicB family nuclease